MFPLYFSPLFRVLSKEANYTFRFEKWVKELIEQKNKFVKSKKKKYIPPLEKEASKNKKAEEKQKLLEEARAAPPLNKDPIRARDLKIICDSMLEVIELM